LKSLGSAGVLAVVVLRDLPLTAAQLQHKIFLSMMVPKRRQVFIRMAVNPKLLGTSEKFTKGTGRYCTVSVMKCIETALYCALLFFSLNWIYSLPLLSKGERR
jgi:hypothetical protein